jgi:hypothetical protein
MKASHRADKKGRGRGTGRFTQLHNYVLDSPAWRSLSLPARCALIEILRVYNGTNNGQLGMAVRYLAERLRCGKTTASRALEELEQKGFLGVQKVGVFGRPMGSEYFVTMHRNNVNFEPPSNGFMRWTEVRTVPSQTSAVPPRYSRNKITRNSPVSGTVGALLSTIPVPNAGHIYIYPRGVRTRAREARPSGAL